MDGGTFIGGLGSALLAAPPPAPAQQAGKFYRIGILEAIPAAQNAARLRGELSRPLFPVRKLRRQDLQRREARRASCGTADQIPARDQPQDCQGARAYDPAIAIAARGRSDPVIA